MELKPEVTSRKEYAMNLNEKQSSKAGVLMVLGGLLYMGLGLMGAEQNQDIAAFLFGGRYSFGTSVSSFHRLVGLTISVQSGFVFFLGAVVFGLGFIWCLKALQVTPTLSNRPEETETIGR